MNKKLKKRISDVVFVIIIAAMIIPTSREWIMRQIAFSPSVNATDEMEQLSSYNWKLRGLNTEDFDFEQARGKVVFVNFWATWCPSCRSELPMIQALYNDYKDKISFVFVTSDSNADVEAFFAKTEFDFPNYNSISRPPEIFTRTNKIPASYLIDKSGNIVIDKVGAADWNSEKIRNLIDELIKK